jgi:diguanylate cyclase (GGDEF)-like protein
MSGAAIILLVNLLIAGLLCGFFLAIALYDRTNFSSRWFAAAYAFGIVYVGGEVITPFLHDASAAYVFSATSFLLALTLLNFGVASRYGIGPWPTLLAGVVGASLLIFAMTAGMARDSMLRQFLYQAPFFATQALAATIVLMVPHKRRIDTVLGVFLAVSAIHYLAKPLVAVALGGVGARSQDYINTAYAIFSQSIGTVFVVATALLLMGMLVRDLLGAAQARSETDPLSGLLNRGAFQLRLAAAVARSKGAPLSLVFCDLDHFKQVNDTFGHAAGDEVIISFAQTLQRATGGRQVVARIGGEEYAVILEGVPLDKARAFAEGARTAFHSERPIEGLHLQSFTASLGVAELLPGESVQSFMLRADRALYAAKHDGRNRVRIAGDEPVANGASPPRVPRFSGTG